MQRAGMELRGRGWLPAAEGSEPEPAGGGGVGAPRSAALSVSLAPGVAVSPSPCQSRWKPPLFCPPWTRTSRATLSQAGGAEPGAPLSAAEPTSPPAQGARCECVFLTPPGL